MLIAIFYSVLPAIALDQVTGELHVSRLEAAYAFRELQAAGLVLVRETDAGQRYAIASDHVRIAIAELLEQAPPSERLGPAV